MFALLLMLGSHFLGQLSTAIGKGELAKKTETTYSYVFLSIFYLTLFLIIGVLLGADFHFSSQSLPYFIPRIVLEIIVAHLGAIAISKADLSTFSFLRLLSIPLVLAIDILVGYSIKPLQMLGILLVFGCLIFLFSKKTLTRAGSGYVIAMALLIPVPLSLFKYDITHFNSVAAEQIIMSLFLMTYFTAAAWMHKKERTWSYLSKPTMEKQSIVSGFGAVLNNYAYTFVPTSIALTFSRTSEILWAIIFGNTIFHEHKTKNKLTVLAVAAVAIYMISYRY